MKLIISKIFQLIGLLGILFLLIYQGWSFLRINFMRVLSPGEQVRLQVEKIFSVLGTPIFWILVILSIAGFFGVRRYKNRIN